MTTTFRSDLSELQQNERKALVGHRDGVLRVVSALRLYRQASRELLNKRYGDGEVDAVELAKFQSTIEDIEFPGLADG